MKVVCQDATMKLYGLTQWKVYDAELTPTMYDPNTFAPSKWYVVKCDDGMERKFTTIKKETSNH